MKRKTNRLDANSKMQNRTTFQCWQNRLGTSQMKRYKTERLFNADKIV